MTAERPGDGDAGGDGGGGEVGGDHDAWGVAAIDPDTGGEAEEEPRQPGGGGEQAGRAGAGVEDEDGEQREDHGGGHRAENRDALAEPEQVEVPVAGEGRGNRCGDLDHGCAGKPRAKTMQDLRSAPSSGISRSLHRFRTAMISSATAYIS